MKHANMLKQATTLSLLAAALLLTQGGCRSCGEEPADGDAAATATATTPEELTGCTWKLDLATLYGVAENVKKPQQPVTLVFDKAGKVSGCAGVNRYFGPVEIAKAGGKLKFGSLGCTMMAGPGLEYERAYLDTLATVDSYEIAEGTLLLKSGDQVVAKLTSDRK